MAFLYLHQDEKIIVFASNCEAVNFLNAMLVTFDWNNMVNKAGR